MDPSEQEFTEVYAKLAPVDQAKVYIFAALLAESQGRELSESERQGVADTLRRLASEYDAAGEGESDDVQ